MFNVVFGNNLFYFTHWFYYGFMNDMFFLCLYTWIARFITIIGYRKLCVDDILRESFYGIPNAFLNNCKIMTIIKEKTATFTATRFVIGMSKTL
jgi:hypothetical protein